MSADAVGKWIAIVVALGGAIGTGYTRIVTLEEARENHVVALTELRQDNKKLEDRVSDLERSREMLERVHKIEMRLGSIEDLLRSERAQSRKSR
jgi:cell division protein FtsB